VGGQGRGLGGDRVRTMQMTPAVPRSLHFGWVVLATGTLVVFGALGLARFGYSLVLPAMQVGLGMDNTQAGALASANLVGYLALAVIGGTLASRFGPRAVITIGLTVAGVAMVLYSRRLGIHRSYCTSSTPLRAQQCVGCSPHAPG